MLLSKISVSDAKRYFAGHLGYIKHADISEIVIETISGETFNCIAIENMCINLRSILVGTYLVFIGNVKEIDGKAIIYIEEYETYDG